MKKLIRRGIQGIINVIEGEVRIHERIYFLTGEEKHKNSAEKLNKKLKRYRNKMKQYN